MQCLPIPWLIDNFWPSVQLLRVLLSVWKDPVAEVASPAVAIPWQSQGLRPEAEEEGSPDAVDCAVPQLARLYA